MATKDKWALPGKTEFAVSGSSSKYWNLNLNKDGQCQHVSSKSVSTELKPRKYGVHEESYTIFKMKNDDGSWKNSKDDLFVTQYPSLSNNNEKQKLKGKDSSNESKSTLSLHIEIYENAVILNTDPMKSQSETVPANKWNNVKKDLFICSTFITNPFEFPRQQESEPSDPEICHYKASQDLLNPNEVNYSYNNLFTLVFKGAEKANLNIVPLPEMITVPRSPGKHVLLFLPKVDTNISDVYTDNLSPWKGKTRYRNYGITMDGDNVKAVEARNADTVTQAQCYSAIHSDYSESGRRITKKIFSATTPSSKIPLKNTVIIIVYEIQNNLTSPQNSSTQLPKRPNNDKVDAIAAKSPKTEYAKTTAQKKGPLNLDTKSLFDAMATTSKTSSSNSVIAATENNKMFDMGLKLKAAEKELLETKAKAKQAGEKLKAVQGQMYNLKRQMERSEESSKESEAKLQSEVATLKEQFEKTNNDYIIQLENAKEQRKIDAEQIKILEDEIASLKKSIEEDRISRDTVVELKKKGKYLPDVHFAMAELQTLGIRDHAVGPAINIVCNMLGLQPNAVPSARTVAFNSFFQQAMNFQQLREILQYAASTNIPTCLSTDESIRNTEIIHSFILSVVDESTNEAREYVLGTLKGLDKSANTILELLQKLVKKLDSDESNKHWETFMMGLGNLMTDQASTNAKFAKDLQLKLQELIEENDQNWDQLTEEQQKDLTTIRSFYCQLHILHNMTAVVVKSMLEHEKYYRNNEELKQPLIFVLLQEIARFLGNRASSKYDVASAWRLFCENHNIKFSTVPDFKGHRFTILFVIAGAVFFLLDDIIKFYNEHKTQMHNAKIDIGAALKDPLILSQLHLLAAINAYITGPMTRLTENSPTINSLSEHSTSLVQFLEIVMDNPLHFLIGYAPFEQFEEADEVTERSKAFIAHLDDVSPLHPDIISDVMEYVSPDLLHYCKTKFSPFLEGGAYHQSTDDLRSVPRSNRRCESVFGFLGSDYFVAPQKRIVRRDIKVQSNVNKNFEWLKAKPKEEREKIILEAMASASKLQADAAEDEKALKIALWKRVLEKKEKDDRAVIIKSRNLQSALNKLQQNGGLWIDEDEMEEMLEPLTATKKRKAVEDQIRYHKLSLQKVSSTSPLFKFSANKVLKNLDTLKNNLKALMTMAAENAEENTDEDDESDS